MKLEIRMVRFINVLKKVNLIVPFLEVLKDVPPYLKFLRELLSKRGDPEEVSVVCIGELCSAVLQS